jgi:hypothetical protein
MRLAGFALTLTFVLAACGGSDGPLSVEDASVNAEDGEVVSVRGALVADPSGPSLCQSMWNEEAGMRCGSPRLMVRGDLGPREWQWSGMARWVEEPVTLRGVVGGGFIELDR